MRNFAYAVITLYCGDLHDVVLYKERSTAEKYFLEFCKEFDVDNPISDYKVFMSQSSEIHMDKE